MSDIEQELLKIEPESRKMQLGKHAVLYYQIIVPAFTFDVVFCAIGRGRAIEVCARSGFSFEIAQRILDFAVANEYEPLSSDAITVLDGFECSPPGFETVTLVPPAIGKRYATNGSPKLDEVTVWAIPGYKCELQDGQSGTDFEFCNSNGGAKIHVVEWDREPTPQVRIQLLTDWPGGALRKRKRPGIMSFDSVVSTTQYIPEASVEVRIVDFRNRELDVTRKGSALEYAMRDGAKTEEGSLPLEAISEYLRRFALGKELK
jgi:hypothetical protein